MSWRVCQRNGQRVTAQCPIVLAAKQQRTRKAKNSNTARTRHTTAAAAPVAAVGAHGALAQSGVPLAVKGSMVASSEMHTRMCAYTPENAGVYSFTNTGVQEQIRGTNVHICPKYMIARTRMTQAHAQMQRSTGVHSGCMGAHAHAHERTIAAHAHALTQKSVSQ